MRILHFADLHIGVENYGRPDPGTGLSTRLLDFLAALDELVDHAIETEVDLVLFCGDAYKSRDPSQTHQREFAKRITRLTAAGIPVFLLVGNHDVPYATGRASAVEIFPTLSVPLVHVGARIETQVVQTRRAGPLQIVAVPWINRSWLLAQDAFKNLPSGTPLNEVMEQKLETALRLQYQGVDAGMPAVLSGHLSLMDAKVGSEQNMSVGADPVFIPATLQGHQGKLDYIGLGHIHVQQIREGHVPMVYPGSMQRVDFGEEGQAKGFYEIELDEAAGPGDRLKSFEFVPVKAREFITIDVRSREGNPTDDVLRTIARRESEIADAVVRVRVSLAGESAGAVLDEAAVRRALDSAHYIASISRDVESAPRGRLGNVTIEELTPMDALRLYLQAKNTPEDRARLLMDHAKRLVEPEMEDNPHPSPLEDPRRAPSALGERG